MSAPGTSRLLLRLGAYTSASAVLLLPVVLPRHVPATDLPSHLYNTWLTLLVREGQAPGLELVPQWSNVLFDWLLEGLWRLGGPVAAEKASVAAAVLVFFWGAFFFVEAITRRPAWSSAPLLAMLAFGWTYHQGFFNYYLSCGFGLWALAWVWNPPLRIFPAAAALLLAALAHPLGAAAAGGLAGFQLFTRNRSWRARALWAAACCAGLAAAGQILLRALPCEWEISQAFHALFATQLRPFGEKYNFFILGVPLLWLVFLGLRILEERMGILRDPALFATAIVAFAIVALPQAVHLPGTARPLHFIDFRLALVLPVWVQAFAASGAPRRAIFLAALLCVLAVPYFAFLVVDYRSLNQAQEEFLRAARQVPAGARTVAAATGLPVQMNPLNHMLSKACIGYCFSYGAYVPSSKAFRLRARPGSPVVLDDSLDVDQLQAGKFVVRPRDLPLYGVFLESATPFRLKVLPLRAGDRIPRQGVRIPPDWF